jgi:hypothetical protein
MRKPTRFKLLLVTVGVCLLLLLSFGGTAFASSQGTHPHLSGPGYVTSSYRSAVVKVHGYGFLPSTDPTAPNSASVSVFASTDSNANGYFMVPVDSNGSFFATLPICGLGLAHDLIEIASEDLTTYLYANIIYTTSD